MTTGRTIALTIRTFVSKVLALPFNMPSRFVIAFLPQCKRLLISWLQSPSSVILEPKKMKSADLSCFKYMRVPALTTGTSRTNWVMLGNVYCGTSHLWSYQPNTQVKLVKHKLRVVLETEPSGLGDSQVFLL